MATHQTARPKLTEAQKAEVRRWVADVSTRLWLSGAVSPTRNWALIDRLAGQIRACAVVAPLSVAVEWPE